MSEFSPGDFIDPATEADPFLKQFTEVIDIKIATQLAHFRMNLFAIADHADWKLAELGKRFAPTHDWQPRSSKPRALTETEQALLPFREAVGPREFGNTRYRIAPGDIGPVPKDLEPGSRYIVSGFGVEGPSCTTLGLPYSDLAFEGAYLFSSYAHHDLITLDGALVEFNGTRNDTCGLCLVSTPIDSFTILDEEGNPERGEFGEHLGLSALRGMVVIDEVLTKQ